MQTDSFKRFSKDLQGVFGIPSGFLSKKSKKAANHQTTSPKGKPDSDDNKRPKSLVYDNNVEVRINKTTTPSTHTLQNISSFSDIGKTSRTEDGHFLSPPMSQAQQQRLQSDGDTGKMTGGGITSSIHSAVCSPISPCGSSRGFAHKDDSTLVHLPPSIQRLDMMSLQRREWIQDFLQGTGSSGGGNTEHPHLQVPQHGANILRTESAWDTVDDSLPKCNRTTILQSPSTGNNDGCNTNESTGLFVIKLIQVTNKASNKIFDVEWNLRVGNIEKTTHPSRSFKDSPGNTATLNEVFMFDVNESFQLDMSVTGHPVATKFGTMAGFSNAQAVHLGHLQLAICLENMEKNVKTLKLRPPTHATTADEKNAAAKTDCEVVIMYGLHILEEPTEDRSWETESLYQGFLTFMTRGARMSNWKRYWAVLEGRAIKLYDAEYQQKRDVLATIPLAYILNIQPPDLEKVDVGANGFALEINPQGIEMPSGGGEMADYGHMDYCLYGFTDSLHFHHVWTAHIEAALDGFKAHLAKRQKLHQARLSRRAAQSLSRHSFESSVPPSPLCISNDDPMMDRVDIKFVW
ncbi:hypothetical protein BGZ94_010173 [Podila epigama]|nr:hypothetical protein BGZ94_010173 [Podila epigama]